MRVLRERRGLTQAELANTLGITQSNVSDMERGVRGLTVHQVVKLAKALRVSADEILSGPNGSDGGKGPRSLKLLRRLRRIEQLPEPRQRAVLKVLDALLDQQGQVK
jgi:transcriptional regulator with XRE-family HTH domain